MELMKYFHINQIKMHVMIRYNIIILLTVWHCTNLHTFWNNNKYFYYDTFIRT